MEFLGTFTFLFGLFELTLSSDNMVTLSTGIIIGRTMVTRNGRRAYIFLGIPYAKEPTKDLRFKVNQ